MSPYIPPPTEISMVHEMLAQHGIDPCHADGVGTADALYAIGVTHPHIVDDDLAASIQDALRRALDIPGPAATARGVVPQPALRALHSPLGQVAQTATYARPPPRSPAQAQARDQDETERGAKLSLIGVVLAEMPPEWADHIGGDCALQHTVHRSARLKVARGILDKLGVAVLRYMTAALRYHKLWCAAHGVPTYPVPTLIACAAIEDYAQDAKAHATERVAKRQRDGGAPRRNERGGETAAKPIRLGYRAFQEKFKLDIDGSSEMVKALSRAGPGMPAIRHMTPLDVFAAYEVLTHSPSHFIAARAGAAWLQCASSLRIVDQLRTPDIRFLRVLIAGRHHLVVAGRATRSKGTTAISMRPLPWRAPIIPITSDGRGVNLTPLLEAMRHVPTMYPKWLSAEGKWGDSPAPFERIVRELRDILQGFPGITSERIAEAAGHDARHLIPEVARVAQFTRPVREALGYWRSPPVVVERADRDAEDRALEAARSARQRTGWAAFTSDRYSAVDGEPIENDEARAAALHLVRAVVTQQGTSIPRDTDAQLRLVRAASVAK